MRWVKCFPFSEEFQEDFCTTPWNNGRGREFFFFRGTGFPCVKRKKSHINRRQKKVVHLGYVKVEIQRFPRQGLRRRALPHSADVLVGEVAGGLHQTGRAAHHQLEDVQRFPPVGRLQSAQVHDIIIGMLPLCDLMESIFRDREGLAKGRGGKLKPDHFRLFIVWACLQIYCTDTRRPLGFQPPTPLSANILVLSKSWF